MKKRYTKPAIVFEDFTLSVAIASCEVKTNTPAKMQCGYEVDDGWDISVLFVSGVQVCTTVEAEGAYDGICYHTFANNNLFNS